MSTIETIFLRVFSELELLQKAHAFQYDLTMDANAHKRFGVQISRLDASRRVTHARAFRQLTESRERAVRLLCCCICFHQEMGVDEKYRRDGMSQCL